MTHKNFLQHIEASEEQWNEALANNSYTVFKIPKSKGKTRLIEAPYEPLKKIQRKIAVFLQEIYGRNLPSCVHGYIPNDTHDGHPRSILSNAQNHIGAQELINIDLKDFFHQVDLHKLNQILENLTLDHLTKRHLRKLCLKNERLPMGAPTSPVLSNMAFSSVDNLLEAFASHHNIKYTRYVDDLSFSSSIALPIDLVGGVTQIIHNNGFAINPGKIKHYRKDEEKEITGIILKGHTFHVSPNMIIKMEKNLKQYAKLERFRQNVAYLGLKPNNNKTAKWRAIKAAIKGQLQFLKSVEGKSSDMYKSMKKAYRKARSPKEAFEFTVYH